MAAVNKFQMKVQTHHTDNGREYMGKEREDYLKEQSTEHHSIKFHAPSFIYLKLISPGFIHFFPNHIVEKIMAKLQEGRLRWYGHAMCSK